MAVAAMTTSVAGIDKPEWRSRAPRQRRIKAASDGGLVVRVDGPAEDGRANTALIELLADHFRVPKRAVSIVRGVTSRRKLVEMG